MTAVDTDLSASSTPSAIAVSPEVERFVADTAQVATEALRPAPRHPGALAQRHDPDLGARARPRLAGRHQPPQPVAQPHAAGRAPPSTASTRTPVLGDPAAARGARRFAAIFEQHAGHHDRRARALAPPRRLGAGPPGAARSATGCWRRPRPSPELPVYIDRRQAEVDYILEQIVRDPGTSPPSSRPTAAATVWGRDGLAAAVELIQVIESRRAHVPPPSPTPRPPGPHPPD